MFFYTIFFLLFIYIICDDISKQIAMTNFSVSDTGCVCLKEWSFNGDIYNNCATPDNDDYWCIVRKTCGASGKFLQESDELSWDWCNPSLAKVSVEDVTRGGCACAWGWIFMNEIEMGCSNPNESPGGSWCVTMKECKGAELYLDSDDEKVYWDYCGAVKESLMKTLIDNTDKVHLESTVNPQGDADY
eukprot:GHVL01027892.1.p1 GENE.GHVL01027892.1~~GHVL01027892.1.p1  ORF type:complete len:196 (+),score=51.76 GHVL01027892.1:27-590(+)